MRRRASLWILETIKIVRSVVQKDALRYIEQLEKELAEADKLLENYRRRFKALKSYITHLADGEHEIKEE